MAKKPPTPTWQEAGLPITFASESERRNTLKVQRDLIQAEIDKLDEGILLKLKAFDVKSARIDGLGTVMRKTNTNVNFSEDLMLKDGITRDRLERWKVRTESKEFIQIYVPKEKDGTEESDDE